MNFADDVSVDEDRPSFSHWFLYDHRIAQSGHSLENDCPNVVFRCLPIEFEIALRRFIRVRDTALKIFHNGFTI